MGKKVRFDENADMEANYTIVNWHRSAEDGSVVFREVGYYNMHVRKGAKLVIDKTKIMWDGYSSEVSRIVFLCDDLYIFAFFPPLFNHSSFTFPDIIKLEKKKKTDTTKKVLKGQNDLRP